MDKLADGSCVFDLPEVIRLLEIEAGGVCAEGRFQGLRVRSAVFGRDDVQLCIGCEAVGLHDLNDLRVRGRRDVSDGALPILAHGDRLGGGCRAVIVRGVGDIHAGQLADHGLEFERPLQYALADLRLIGGIARHKLLTGRDGLHDGGNEMTVAARAAQNGPEDPVLFGQCGHPFAHLQLAQTGGQGEPVLQSISRGTAA